MKTLLLTFILSAFQWAAHAQLSCKIVLNEHEPINEMYLSNNPEEINEYWNEDQIKIKLEPLNDSIFLRSEFYEDGSLLNEYQLLCVKAVDTVVIEDIDTGYFEDKIKVGYRFIPSGNYLERGRHNLYTVRGSYFYGLKNGEWSRRNMRSEEVVMTYFLGEPVGDYYEYYYRADRARTTLRCKGQFKHVTFRPPSYTVAYIDTGELVEVTPEKYSASAQVGKWKYYSENGKLIKFIKFGRPR